LLGEKTQNGRPWPLVRASRASPAPAPRAVGGLDQQSVARLRNPTAAVLAKAMGGKSIGGGDFWEAVAWEAGRVGAVEKGALVNQREGGNYFRHSPQENGQVVVKGERPLPFWPQR